MAQRGEGRGERRTGVEQLVPSLMIASLSWMTAKLSAYAAMSVKPQPSALGKLQSKTRSGQVTEANALVNAVILVTEVLEERMHSIALYLWRRK